MPCLVLLFALIGPRVALVVMAIVSDRLSDSFGGILLPLIGFLVLPWTTLAFALLWGFGTNEVSGFEWLLVALVLLLEVGLIGGSGRRGAKRGRRG